MAKIPADKTIHALVDEVNDPDNYECSCHKSQLLQVRVYELESKLREAIDLLDRAQPHLKLLIRANEEYNRLKETP